MHKAKFNESIETAKLKILNDFASGSCLALASMNIHRSIFGELFKPNRIYNRIYWGTEGFNPDSFDRTYKDNAFIKQRRLDIIDFYREYMLMSGEYKSL